MPVPARKIVSVAGPDRSSPITQEVAREVGRYVMGRGFHLLVGGTGAVTTAACEGAQEEKVNLRRRGKFVGEAPVVMAMLGGSERGETGDELDLVLATGLGSALHAVVGASSDALIAIEGGADTLTHVAMAWHLKKPIVLLAPTGSALEHLVGEKIDAHRADIIMAADSAERAVELIADALAARVAAAAAVPQVRRR